MSPTYTNPVFAGDFPDPFVLRWGGRYYAYGTGRAVDGKQLRMMSSDDLVHWTPHGGVLEPLDLPGAEEYWAPEVAYREGTFYLYYATGRAEDPDHHLRLLAGEGPAQPDPQGREEPGDEDAVDLDRVLEDQEAVLDHAQDDEEDPAAESVKEDLEPGPPCHARA